MTLKYPADIDGSRDFMKFTIGDYVAPIRGAGEEYAGGYTSDYSTTPLRGETIILNMPSDIGSTFTGAWAGKNTTGLAQAALGVVRSAGAVKDDAKKMQEQLQTGILDDAGSNILKQLLGAGVEDAIRFLGDTLGSAPGLGANLGANDFLQIGTGQIINPNTELFYGGNSLRTHAYNFKLIPQSQAEASSIIQIVERFKKACLPKKESSLFGTDFKNFIKVPEVCQITFCGAGGGENENLPKYKVSAFTSVSTSYITDGQYMSFRGGEPIGINLTLTLTELKLVYNEDIGSKAR